MLSRIELRELLESIEQVTSEMFEADKELCHADCTYSEHLPMLIAGQYDPPIKVLESTRHYQKVYADDMYLGRTYKTDTRFDSNGQYIKSGKWYE